MAGEQRHIALVAHDNKKLDLLNWAQPHDPDVKALLRIAAVWNIGVACNLASADLMISSPLLAGPYDRFRPDYGDVRMAS